MRVRRLSHRALFFAFAASLAACATRAVDDAAPLDRAAAEQWAANGWLTPGQSGEPEIIGLYITRAECEAALADWLTRQVVGNPVHGACLPIDRR